MRDFTKSCVYQIYIKSFCDSNGDGIGDISGITGKLDYIKSLGVDYIWITPFFRSPLNDNGYDVSDYRSIDPVFGTMEQLETLIAEADKRGIGLMLDMVFNHTSTEHEWFRRALAGEEKYINYYKFVDGEPDSPPTNWESKFGGNAWEYVPSLKKWYLHLFDVSQADLNWDNPEVREELKDILRFWTAKGIKGFRFDVINLVSKPDVPENDTEGDGRRFYTDGPRIHEYLKDLVEGGGIADMLTVGEMSSTTIDNCIRYSDPAEKELSMCFSFHHLKVDYENGDKWTLMRPDFGKLKKLLTDWQIGMQEGGGWNAVFWCNHDQPRAVSRFGDDKRYRKESAKMLAGMIHLLRGTPYIFQGEEIGTTNAGFTDISQYRDVESLNYYEIMLRNGKTREEALAVLAAKSRDNGRTPMQWTGGRNAGFTGGEPWIGIPENYTYINTEEASKDPDSILAFYKKLIALRKKYDIIADGSFEPIETSDNMFAYRRRLGTQTLTVLCNLTGEKTDTGSIPEGELLIGNYKNERSGTLEPYEFRAYLK